MEVSDNRGAAAPASDNRGAAAPAIGVIVNPRAGAARDAGLPVRLRAVLAAAGQRDPSLVVAPPEAAALGPALAQLLAWRGADGRPLQALAVCGGDGTLSAVATALAELCPLAPGPTPGAPPAFAAPALALLRGGTVNTIARNFAIRGRPEQLLARLAAQVQRGALNAAPAQLLTVHHRAAGEPPRTRYGFLFATAMGARFLATYNQEPGLSRAALLTLRTVGSTLIPGGGELARRLFAEAPVELRFSAGASPDDPTGDDQDQAAPFTRFRLILAATVPDVGMGMRVTWRGGRDLGRFHLVASRLPIAAMARQLPRILSGRPLRGGAEEHLDQPAAWARLRFLAQGGAARPEPQPCTLDGELFLADELLLRAAPTLALCR